MLSDLTNTRGGGRANNSAEDILTPEHSLETFAESIPECSAESIANSSAESIANSSANSSAESIANSYANSSTESIANSSAEVSNTELFEDKKTHSTFILHSCRDNLYSTEDCMESFADASPQGVAGVINMKSKIDDKAVSSIDVEAAVYVNEVTRTEYDSSLSTGTKLFAEQLVSSSISDCIKINNDFDEAFAHAFPEVVANERTRTSKLLTENKQMAFCDTDFNYTGNNVATPTVSLLWNVNYIVHGSFHQNDARFSDQSRGFQCTCNALCMIAYSAYREINSGTLLDEILHRGDAIYRNTIDSLKAQGKYVHPLLSLEEVPDTLEIDTGKIPVEKQSVISGFLVAFPTNNDLHTLHSALQLAFNGAKSCLLTTGSICSAVTKTNDSYLLFDPHCHEGNGLSSSSGTSILILFSCLEDLITYLYALYDSMGIDMSWQFDLLPVNMRKTVQKYTQGQMLGSLEAYFKDQYSRQQKKAQINIDHTSTLQEARYMKKKKDLKTYYKMYKKTVKMQPGALAKERAEKQRARRQPGVLAMQNYKKQAARQDDAFKAKEKLYQRASKQGARKQPGILAKECAKKQIARQDDAFKAKEKWYQRASKQEARKQPGILAKECAKKQIARRQPSILAKECAKKQAARQDYAFKAKEKIYQCASKQGARKQPGILAKECAKKQIARQDDAFKAKEKLYQRASKQGARQQPGILEKECVKKQIARRQPGVLANERAEKQIVRRQPGILAKECAKKQAARQDDAFKMKEKVYQRTSKQNARKNSFILESERIKQQERRSEKRKLDDLNESRKSFKGCLYDHLKASMSV